MCCAAPGVPVPTLSGAPQSQMPLVHACAMQTAVGAVGMVREGCVAVGERVCVAGWAAMVHLHRRARREPIRASTCQLVEDV